MDNPAARNESGRVTWAGLPGARYRLELLDAAGDKAIASIECDRPEADLPELLQATGGVSWQVLAYRPPLPGWHVVKPAEPVPFRAGTPVCDPAGAARLTWPSVPDATGYRVALLDGPAAKARTVYRGSDTHFALPAEPAEAPRPFAYRVEVEFATGERLTLVPWMRLDAARAGDRVIAHDGLDEAPAYRLYLRDEHTDMVALDVVAREPRFTVDPAALPSNHRLRYRILAWAWRERKWQPVAPYKLLELGPEPG